MGQLFAKFANGNPHKGFVKLEVDLPGWTAEEKLPVEIVVDGVVFKLEFARPLRAAAPQVAPCAA